MSGPRLVDTNLIVRHLTQDHAKHGAIAGRLFAACDRGELTLVVLPSVLAECVFVLESFYKHPRDEIGRVLSALIASPGVDIADLEIHLDALTRYAASKLHFVDCTIAATAVAEGLGVASFDLGLAKLKDVRVELD
jgi:predicted nucleic-acid-binding protein